MAQADLSADLALSREPRGPHARYDREYFMINIHHDPLLDDEARRETLFEGDLVLYPRRSSTAALCDHALAMAAEAFAPHEPERAQFALRVEDFAARAGALKTRFTNDRQTKELIRAILDDLGCDLEQTYFDVPRLRIVPSDNYLSSGVSYVYKAHRDTWYSSPHAQVNYWMPAFAILPGRAMSFFPAYWDKELPNSSAGFDYGEWCRVGRTQALGLIKEDTRKHPLPTAPVDGSSELRIAGTKGDMILFSAAHLHATAPNCSGLTRFSIDFRTVHLEDLRTGRGAPNIDCAATGTTLRDFLRASDFTAIDLDALTLENIGHAG